MSDYSCYREKVLSNIDTIVIKVGTLLLLDNNQQLDYNRIELLIENIHFLQSQGYKVVLVSSGAIASGMGTLNIKERPTQLKKLQALAAIGQSNLLAMYEKACNKFGFHCAQVLLTLHSFDNEKQEKNFHECLNSLFALNSLPIINENDVIATDEICFGDNDFLSYMISKNLAKCFTIIFTNVDGLYKIDKQGNFTEQHYLIHEIDETITNLIISKLSNLSRGGMDSKIKIANGLLENQQSMLILNGKHFDNLKYFFKKQKIGTLFTKK